MDDLPGPPDLEIACYQFLFRVTHPISLPEYKGSTFHGGFGHALARIGRRFLDYFFASPASGNRHSRQVLPKPFMLVPPLEEKRFYDPGDEMQCGLILFGEAIRHFMIAFAAMESLGQDLGLGRSEGRFRIESVDQLTLDGPHRLFADDDWFPGPEPVRARKVLEIHRIESRRADLSLATRLRLKHNNLLVREAPSFSVLFGRLAGRINSLAAFYGGGMLMPPSEKREMLEAAKAIRLDPLRTTARWVEWTRPAKPGKEEMSFGGLLGEIGYIGEMTPFTPWLALGQWTGLGGKTSFGLGLYHLEIKGGDDGGML